MGQDLAWRAFGHDAQRSGQAEGPGPAVPEQAWSIDTTPTGFSFGHAVGSDGTIYSSYSGELVARASDGSTLWQFAPSLLFGAPLLSADETTVFVGARDVSMYALNVADGTVRWRYPGVVQWVEPMAEAVDGTIYGIEATQVVAVNPDGTEKWRHAAGGTVGRITLSAEGDLILSTADEIRSVSAAGALMWQRSRSSWGLDGAVKGIVGAPDGSIVVCTDFDVHKWSATGADVFRVRHRCQQVAVASDGTIAAGRHAVSTFAPDGTLRWTVNVEGNSGASAGLVYDSDGVLYVGSGESSVRAFDRNGQSRWSVPIPHEARTIALGPGKRLVVSTYDASSQASALLAVDEAPSPALLVSDRSVVFYRGVAPGESASESVTLTNAGAATVTITAVGLVGVDAGSFELASGSPQTVGAGQQAVFTLSYSPTEARAHTAELVVTTDGFSGERRIELIGDSGPAGLAGSGWPHPAADPGLTGRSSARAPGLDASIQWESCLATSDAFMTRVRPVVGPEGNVYFGFSGQTVAVSKSGAELWRRRPGSAQTAVRSDGVVLFSSDALRAFSPRGSHLWTFFGDGISNTDGPAVVAPDGTIYYVSVSFSTKANSTLHALDHSGRELWKTLIGSTGTSMDVGLTSSGNIVVGGGLGVWMVDTAGTILWTRAFSMMEPAIGPGDVIYVAHTGGLEALDPSTGASLWSNPDATRSPVSVASDGTIVAGTRIYNTDGSTRFSGLRGNSGVAISGDDVILLNNLSTVFAYDLNGSQLWQLSATKISSNPPVVGEDGRIYVAGNGCLYAIGGQVDAPVIALDPSAVDFGPVSTGITGQGALTVSNFGSVTLTVSSLEIVGADADQFAVLTPSAPFDVGPLSVGAITLAFSPASVGQKTASLVVGHNAQGSPSRVDLAGFGTTQDVPLVPEPAQAVAEPGGEFDVEVRVGDGIAVPTDLFGIGFKLRHDRSLDYLSAEPGPLLYMADPDRFTFFEQQVEGAVSIAASRNQPESGVTEAGVVAVVRFRVPADATPGPVTFVLDDVLAVNSQGQEIVLVPGMTEVEILDGFPAPDEVRVVAPDPTAGEMFGWSMYEYGGRLIVGAPDPGNAPVSAGRAVVFRPELPGEWDPWYVVTPSDGAVGDDFGTAVAYMENIFVVGARDHDAAGLDEGAVYVFRDEGTSATELEKLLPPAPSLSDAFGRDIDVDADNGRLIVGGHYWNSATGSSPGAAYVYRVAGESLVLEAVLAENVLPDDFYAAAVAISGDHAFVGAYRIDNQRGRVWIYKRDAEGSWSLHQELTASDASDLARFGVSVDVHGNTAVVGAHIEGVNFPGAAYVLELDGGQWVETQKLTAPDAEEGEWFGNPVAVTSSHILIGALRESDGATSQGGAVYVFGKETGTWTAARKVIPSDRGSLDWFGSGLHVYAQETRFYGGATRHDAGSVADAGAVYQFLLETAPPTELTLWPGDTDGSGEVSETDLFPIANCFGLTGRPREGDFDISWQPVVVAPWGSAPSGCSPATTIDPALADATGDGIVNHEDVLPVGVNFGRTPADTARGGGTEPPLPRKTVSSNALLRIAVDPASRPVAVSGLSVQIRVPEGVEPLAARPGAVLDGQLLEFWSFDRESRVVHAAASLIRPQSIDDPVGGLLELELESVGPIHEADLDILAATLNTPDGPLAIVTSAVTFEWAAPVSTFGSDGLPARLGLAVAPNPARGDATVRLELPSDASVHLALYDVLGREIRTLATERRPAGRHRFDLSSGNLAAGVYFVRVEIDSASLTKSLVITR